jgi:serine phosphatase RsbU (regulator of sigma subunit)
LYDISFIMKPASEIGGDFYDMIVSDDGTITFAVGDATGHGAKAGAMVTAMKILFTSFAEKMDIADFLKKADRTLRKINLPRLYMSFTIGRLKGNTLEIAGVGMPSLLIYSDSGCNTCNLSMKGFPLGSNYDFDYTKQLKVLGTNDVLLVMTDGLPELFNWKKETIGYEAVEKEFFKSATHTPKEIINRLINLSEEWMENYPQQDDITLLVIKRKSTLAEKINVIPANGSGNIKVIF